MKHQANQTNQVEKKLPVLALVLAFSPAILYFVPYFWTSDIVPLVWYRWLGYASLVCGILSAVMLFCHRKAWSIIVGVLSLLFGLALAFFFFIVSSLHGS